MDTLKGILEEVVLFLFFPALTVGFGILSAVVDSTGLSWLFAILAVVALGFFIIKYWIQLYITGIILAYLGGGLIFAGATSLLWMTIIDYPLGPGGKLVDWGWFFSFFYILWIAMGVVAVLVYTQAIGIIAGFIKGIFNSK